MVNGLCEWVRDVRPMMPQRKKSGLQFWDGKPLYIFASSPDHQQLISGDDRPVPVTIGGPEVVAQRGPAPAARRPGCPGRPARRL